MVDALDASPILLSRAIESTMETGKEYALTLVGSGISTSLTISGYRDRGLSSGKTGKTLATPQIAADRG
jgi:hypothetical protein